MNRSGPSFAGGHRRPVSRRAMLQGGGAGLAALSLMSRPALAEALGMQPGEEILPWHDRRDDNPMPDVIRNQPEWEELDSWITPNERFFGISRYEYIPQIDAGAWRLRLSGLMRDPVTLDLEELRARPREEVTALIDCAGNHGLPFLDAGVGNARWAGTPLAALLEEAGLDDDARHIVFFGADRGEEEVHGVGIEENFARSMPLEDAMTSGALIVYEMNGADLPARNGYPVRLVVPGWYGMASVKWLERIEAHATPYMGRFQADEYVTLRSREVNGETVWTRNKIDRQRLKSVPAHVTAHDGAHRIVAAAWGGEIDRVELRIDDGDWRAAERIEPEEAAAHAWSFWSLDWEDAAEGEHAITARAIDTAGNVQPTPEDPEIANKHTYWESNGQVTRRIVVG